MEKRSKPVDTLDSEVLIASELSYIEPRRSREEQENEALQKILSGLDSWSFDIFQIHDDKLPKMVEKIFEELGFFDAFPLDIKRVQGFTCAMLVRYQPNPYHNFRHACDVLHAVYLILTITEAGNKFTLLEKLALALAALCHDVDHPGLTNAFLVATYDPLALRYNDRAVLESHHAATSFITMRGHDGTNLLNGLNEVEQRHIRKLMLIIILATDMEQHSRILQEMLERLARPDPFELSPPYTPPGSLSPLREEFNSFPSSPPSTSREPCPKLEEGTLDAEDARVDKKECLVKVYRNPLQSAPPITSSNDVLLLLQMIIKCADISNVVKPFFLSKRWAALLLLEWFRQGEIEKQIGLPISKFMDREDPSTLMAMTCGCIDYIAKPMYEATAKMLPKLQEEVLMNLSFNRQMWNQFSTNGRRASETAQQILGQFAPPPIPKGTGSDDRSHLEGKLVATFSGQYIDADAQTTQKQVTMDTHTVEQTETMDTPKIEEVTTDTETNEKQVIKDTETNEKQATMDTQTSEKQVTVSQAAILTTSAYHHPELSAPASPPSEPEEQTADIVQYLAEPQGILLPQDAILTTTGYHHPELGASPPSEPTEQTVDIAIDPMADLQGKESPEAEPEFAPKPPVEDEVESEDEEQTVETEAEPGEEYEVNLGSEMDLEAGYSGSSMGEAPLSLLFGLPNNEESLLLPGKPGKGSQPVSLVPGLLPSANLLIVDRNKKSIDAMAFRVPANVSSPSSVRPPSFRRGGVESDVQKEKPVVPQVQARRGFWENIRTHPRVARLNKALDSNVWNAVFIVATFLALFADDVVKGFLPKAADKYEAHLLTACLVLFLFEAMILTIFRDGYFFSFFFWLDLLGSLTLVPLIIGVSSQNLVLARTGRAAKTITRASKLLQASHIKAQIASFLPVVRFLKCIGQYRDSSLISPEYEESEEHVSSKPSQLWTRLSELTTQKLILGVLILIIVYPYFGTDEKDLAPLVSLNGLDYYTMSSLQFNDSISRLLMMNENHGYELVYLGVKTSCIAPPEGGTPTCVGIDPEDIYVQLIPDPNVIPYGQQAAVVTYRVSELISVTSDSTRATAYYSVKRRSKLKYGMNIALTVLVLAILAIWCFFLSRDSNRLLIQPIERMVQFVKELAEDPVSFAGKTILRPAGDKGKMMETFFVEAALVKIASLTKVALGDAGMDILSVNLKGSEFNPMLPGKKIRACFGFCDIRNFTDATECLQEDVMMFVNRIADVVHNKVVLHSGFPNKNIGDAFLIVWKKTVSDNTNKSRATSFADRALRSFLDIIQCIETSQSLAEFAKHPAIQKRMPGYRIHMGFGLHVGWAIEGAIGSAHKVDPSYLSPHVNMASRLEAATKQYGVMLLISETVIAHLTKSSLRDSCRKLDRVTVKGSHEPLVLYTFDIPLFQQDLRGNPAEYRDIFEEAVDNYIEGEWSASLEKLEECSSLWPTDKPAQVLLNFMASHNYTAPADWQGYRELTEK